MIFKSLVNFSVRTGQSSDEQDGMEMEMDSRCDSLARLTAYQIRRSPSSPRISPARAQPQTPGSHGIFRYDSTARPLIFEARWHLVGISSPWSRTTISQLTTTRPNPSHHPSPSFRTTPTPSTVSPIRSHLSHTSLLGAITTHLPSKCPTKCKRSSTCRASSSGRASSSSASRKSVSDHPLHQTVLVCPCR